MNFAYLDAAGLLENLTRPQPEPIVPLPCELDETWKDFEKTLGEFKSEFVKVRAELTRSTAVLNEKKEELSVLKMMLDNVSSSNLKERLEEMIQEYEESEQVPDLTVKCAMLAGRAEAMKKVLMDTNSERYGKFTCFVCMDRLVDLFIEPCGHVICERCWIRTPNKEQCPGCRARTMGAKKIFTMN
jgi:predicted nuclease with TOPRIM domain